MGWKDWSYVKKGAIIGAIIGLIVGLLDMIFGGIFFLLPYLYSLFLFKFIYLVENVGIFLVPYGILIGAVYGVIIGWIIGKIKSRKQTN